jgi:hypothetical protein
MAVVSVSTETDTTATKGELPTREQSVHESCPTPSLSSAARRRVRLSHPRARLRRSTSFVRADGKLHWERQHEHASAARCALDRDVAAEEPRHGDRLSPAQPGRHVRDD